MLDEIRLADLRTFSLVVRHGGFSSTARATDIPQTTISKRVAVLEEAVGAKLIHRTTRQFNLTDEGKRVYEWAQKILDDATEMGNELSTSKREPHGPLRISASTRLGRSYVAPVLALMKSKYPHLNIWLEIVDRRVDLVKEGLHLDVRTGEPTEPHLIGHRIHESARILCASPKYLTRRKAPTNLTDLRNHECILFKDRNEPLGVWRLKGPKGWETVGIQSELASNDNEVVLDWAKKGLGIMLATDWFFAQSLQSGQLTRVLPDWQEPADVWAVSTSRTPQSAKIKVFLDLLRQEMKKQHP